MKFRGKSFVLSMGMLTFLLSAGLGYAIGNYWFHKVGFTYDDTDVASGNPETIRQVAAVYDFLLKTQAMDSCGILKYRLPIYAKEQQQLLRSLCQQNFFVSINLHSELKKGTTTDYLKGIITLGTLSRLLREMSRQQSIPDDIPLVNIISAMTVWHLTLPKGFIPASEHMNRRSLVELHSRMLSE